MGRTTQADIRGWLEQGKANGATHVIVACDTFDYEDYPVNVMPGQDPRKVAEDYDRKDMQTVMEVYALHLDWDSQLNERRSKHFELAPGSEPAEEKKPRLALVPRTSIVTERVRSMERVEQTEVLYASAHLLLGFLELHVAVGDSACVLDHSLARVSRFVPGNGRIIRWLFCNDGERNCYMDEPLESAEGPNRDDLIVFARCAEAFVARFFDLSGKDLKELEDSEKQIRNVLTVLGIAKN